MVDYDSQVGFLSQKDGSSGNLQTPSDPLRSTLVLTTSLSSAGMTNSSRMRSITEGSRMVDNLVDLMII